MCQNGFNSADYKLAIHQLTEQTKVIKTSSEQWARLSGSVHQDELSAKLGEAGAKLAEAIAMLDAAMDAAHDHGHDHVHIS
ncbi:MAG TPA: hypothetical protein VGK02_08945 [Candidatus Aquicultor sp.]|jgi:hypothetical protein